MATVEKKSKKIAIIGAGFGGIAMAIELKKAGEEDFWILEKGGDVGGVWRDNTYPGCSCDVPSHLYSFSFSPYRSRTKRYEGQEGILSYLQQVVEKYKLKEHLRLNFEISKAKFHKDKNQWEISTKSESEFKESIRADVIIFAVGQLHNPYTPDIAGMEGFIGDQFHSATWKHNVDLHDKHISVIGTGSSAAQMLPELAKDASKLTIFQREPHWVLPKPDADFGRIERLLLRLPGAHDAYRSILCHGADMLLSPVARSSALRSSLQWYARRNLRRQVCDEELAQKLMPSHPIGTKRIVFDNEFYSTLNKENVHLITEPIASVGSDEIKTQSGTAIKADVIIFATGFKASDFLLSIDVEGRDNHSLKKDWAGGPQAFMGLAVHGYPNLFMIAGPNTFNPAGSNPDMKELQIAYISKCLRWKEEIKARTIEVSKNAANKYQTWLNERLEKTVWSKPEYSSWYKNESGKVTNPWPESRRMFEQKLQEEPKCSFCRS